MGSVIWITGLSASGKTTLAKELLNILKKEGYPVIGLDGDELRTIFISNKDSSYEHNRDSRLGLAIQYSKLCKLLSNTDNIIIISTISMFKEIHKWNRENIKKYFEIYLKVPISELTARDPKQIYKKYFRGEIKNVAGLDIEIDEPQQPNLTIEFPDEPDTKAIVKLIKKLY